MWWKPILDILGPLVLKYGLSWLEQKYPGFKQLFDKIIEWLRQQAANGNHSAVYTLHQHVDKLCNGVACSMDTKRD